MARITNKLAGIWRNLFFFLLSLFIPELVASQDWCYPGQPEPCAPESDEPFGWEFVYTGEVFGNVRGGLNTHDAVAYRDDFSLYLNLDTEAMGWWEGGEFFGHLQAESGNGITERDVGDFQVLSNIDADDFSQVSEIWYRHEFENAWIKFGKLEANVDFAFVDFGCEFINSSPGVVPTVPLTTYPDPDWGVVIGLEPTDWFTVVSGVYQGDPDGGRSIGSTLRNLENPMYMIEPALSYDLCGLEGVLRLGLWKNETPGTRFDGGSYDDREGWYLTWDQWLYRENPSDVGCGQGIGMFAQYGHSNEQEMEAHEYWGLGVVGTGLCPTRDNDSLGVWVGHVDLSDAPGAGFEADGETALEVFYKAQINDRLSIKPDLQYIVNPGGTDNKSALALGIRCEFVY
ncbi:MAG: carbohydrate porin [Candidatus Omnitrophica bacterium]|nr:carbohydrate porin [Candidatus Omnitrophota bacterium]MCA9418004.1 carbohydrate porin [Candidatus Omnitrophota bacterium]MCA9424434.1 carbohydrate porin [Candidatus Omnitrophota bacterium]MCB9770071.1 carbohydrate porin [Candidatus Omnitrophota bacterium]